MARLGYTVKAVPGANWHLSTRLPGGRPAPAHPLLTTLTPAPDDTKPGPGPHCPAKPLWLQRPRQATATGTPDLPAPDMPRALLRHRAWFMHSNCPLSHSPTSGHFKPIALEKEDPTIQAELSSACLHSWTSGGPTPEQEIGLWTPSLTRTCTSEKVLWRPRETLACVGWENNTRIDKS